MFKIADRCILLTAGQLGDNAGPKGDVKMADSVYKLIELVGTSTESWEKAARTAVEMAAKSVRGIRKAEVVELDMHLDDGEFVAYRAKVKISFKYEGND